MAELAGGRRRTGAAPFCAARSSRQFTATCGPRCRRCGAIEVLEDAHEPADHGFKVGERLPGVSEVATVRSEGRKIFAAVHHDTPRGVRVSFEGGSLRRVDRGLRRSGAGEEPDRRASVITAMPPWSRLAPRQHRMNSGSAAPSNR